jgi:D-Tyr-tRNAtyr deacylase
MFLDLVQQLTGKPLSGDAWVAVLEKGTEVLLKEEREDYEKSLKEVETKVKDGSKNDDDEEEINLNMTIRFVDGDVLISDSSKDSVLKACQEFELYVLNRIGN